MELGAHARIAFTCSDCSLDKPIETVYIYKFVKGSDENRNRRGSIIVDGDLLRCHPCHTLRSRIYRCKESRTNLGNLDKASRSTFMQDSTELFGNDLNMKLRENFTEQHVESDTTDFNNNGHFMDEDDMTEKYKNKPQQLESIWLNAARIYCPVRNIQLYADPDYTMNLNNKGERSKRGSRTMERDMNVRAAKKLKKEKTPKGEVCEPAIEDLPDLKEVHIIALEKILVKHTKAKTDADTFKERLPAVEEIVPKSITHNFTMELLQLDQAISECQLAVANRKTGRSAL